MNTFSRAYFEHSNLPFATQSSCCHRKMFDSPFSLACPKRDDNAIEVKDDVVWKVLSLNLGHRFISHFFYNALNRGI